MPVRTVVFVVHLRDGAGSDRASRNGWKDLRGLGEEMIEMHKNLVPRTEYSLRDEKRKVGQHTSSKPGFWTRILYLTRCTTVLRKSLLRRATCSLFSKNILNRMRERAALNAISRYRHPLQGYTTRVISHAQTSTTTAPKARANPRHRNKALPWPLRRPADPATQPTTPHRVTPTPTPPPVRKNH